MTLVARLKRYFKRCFRKLSLSWEKRRRMGRVLGAALEVLSALRSFGGRSLAKRGISVLVQNSGLSP